MHCEMSNSDPLPRGVPRYVVGTDPAVPGISVVIAEIRNVPGVGLVVSNLQFCNTPPPKPRRRVNCRGSIHKTL